MVLPQIKNYQQLVDAGQSSAEKKARATLLGAIEAALAAVSPEMLLQSRISLEKDRLCIEKENFNLNNFKQIFVVGAGKASIKMGEALEKLLGPRINEGLLNVPEISINSLQHIATNLAGHPVPDAGGVNGATRILNLAKKAGVDDLVICLLSGGGSSLLPLPAKNISLDEKRMLTSALLKSGATIREINLVRKHLSEIKGGGLARAAFPASVINLVLSDVIGDPLEVIASGPTVGDPSTFAQARQILEKFEIWQKASPSIQTHICQGIQGRQAETLKPEDSMLAKVHNFIIGSNHDLKRAATNHLVGRQIITDEIKISFEGSCEDTARQLLNFLQKNQHFHRQIGFALVAGGETTVKVTGSGQGGRAQHLALAFAELAAKSINRPFVFAALGSDGIDGPTDAAGAMVSNATFTTQKLIEDFRWSSCHFDPSHGLSDRKGRSLSLSKCPPFMNQKNEPLYKSKESGITPDSYLRNHDSYSFFSQAGGLIKTGYTGTNVNDLYLAYFY